VEIKHNLDSINLKLDHVDFWGKNNYNQGGIKFYWSSKIGYGTLDIIKQSGGDGEDFDCKEKLILSANTEYMDSNDDKEFTAKLLALLAEKLKIVE
jgi:hypothetical protein